MAAPLVVNANPQGYRTVDAIAARCHMLTATNGPAVVAHMIRASDPTTRNGRHGESGYNGSAGHHGNDGHDGHGEGSSGSAGGMGTRGENGGRGADGERGADARDVQVHVSGRPDMLTVNDSLAGVANVNLGDRGLVYVSAKGGNGGSGGDGGSGGGGGQGGRGGNGAAGRDGRDAHSPGQRGGNGQRGGSGGPGGRGGPGGDGGSGGNGAPGARGANVVISAEATEASLLVLVETDARAGYGGAGGAKGWAGSGGSGGWGGNGGPGGRGGNGGPAQEDSQGKTIKSAGSSGSSGSSGNSGSSGSSGSSGRWGHRGANARDGPVGSVTYQIVAGGAVVERSQDRFNAAVMRYQVADHNQDGIFEPGTEVFITEARYVNNGGLTLPGGALLQFPSTPSAMSANITEILPETRVGNVVESKTVYRLMIPDATGPEKNKNYEKRSLVTSHVSLLGRVFDESLVTQELVVQYPVKITNIVATAWLGPNEVTTLTYTITNISAKPYGLHHQHDTGNVVFQLRVDPIFQVLPTNDGSYTISADGVAIRPIESLAPNGGTFTISIHVLMKGEAGLRLYESVPWMAELYLRDRCIEYWTRPIRITPVFLPGGNSDVVLVTCADVDRREFLAWSYMVQLLGLSVNFWDIERYSGMSNEDFTWVGQTRILVYLVVPRKADLSNIRFADFLAHFNGDKDNAMLFVGCLASNMDALMYDYRVSAAGLIGSTITSSGVPLLHASSAAGSSGYGTLAPASAPAHGTAPLTQSLLSSGERTEADSKVKGSAAATENKPWTSYAIEEPERTDAFISADGIRKTKEKTDKDFLYSASVDVHISKVGMIQYDYGRYGLYKAVLPRTAKITCLPPITHAVGSPPVLKHNSLLATAGQWLPFDFDGKTFKARTEGYDANAPFTRAFLALFELLPIERRIAIMCDYSYVRSISVTFPSAIPTGPRTVTQPFCDIALASFAQEIEHEFWTMPKEFVSCNRMIRHITNHVQHTPAVPYVAAAIQSVIKKTFWKAFPWCCGDVSARRTQLTGYVNQVARLQSRINEVKSDPAADKTDAAGPERQKVMAINNAGGVTDFVTTKLSDLKWGHLLSMKDMHKAQYCAATARSQVVIPEEKIVVIRQWQQHTFFHAADEKRRREEKKAWLERKIIIMQAPPPPPVYFESAEKDLATPAMTGFHHDAKYGDPTKAAPVWVPTAQGHAAFAIPDAADRGKADPAGSDTPVAVEGGSEGQPAAAAAATSFPVSPTAATGDTSSSSSTGATA